MVKITFWMWIKQLFSCNYRHGLNSAVMTYKLNGVIGLQRKIVKNDSFRDAYEDFLDCVGDQIK